MLGCDVVMGRGQPCTAADETHGAAKHGRDKTNKAAIDGCRRNTGGSHTRLPAETGKGQPEWLPFLYGGEWVPFLDEADWE